MPKLAISEPVMTVIPPVTLKISDVPSLQCIQVAPSSDSRLRDLEEQRLLTKETVLFLLCSGNLNEFCLTAE